MVFRLSTTNVFISSSYAGNRNHTSVTEICLYSSLGKYYTGAIISCTLATLFHIILMFKENEATFLFCKYTMCKIRMCYIWQKSSNQVFLYHITALSTIVNCGISALPNTVVYGILIRDNLLKRCVKFYEPCDESKITIIELLVSNVNFENTLMGINMKYIAMHSKANLKVDLKRVAHANCCIRYLISVNNIGK